MIGREGSPSRAPATPDAPTICRPYAFFILWASIAAGMLTPAARGQEDADCLKCHGTVGLKVERDGRDLSLHVDADRFGESIHGEVTCVSCHEPLDGVEDYPHAVGLEPVDCGQCHDAEEEPQAAYWRSTHGQRVQEDDPEAPRCQDCHGNHYIKPLVDVDSAISPFLIPAMCAQCHAEDAEVARTHDIPQEQIVQRYTQSIHGEGLFKQGLVVTAVCTSCHTGHNVLPHTDPDSTIHKDNIVDTCTQCHGIIEPVHRKVIAGELWERQGVVPICVECHSPHEARKVFYDTNMSNADCLRCHGDPGLKASDDGRSLFIDAEVRDRSIHARRGVNCAQCHTGTTPSLERACASITEPVNCSICHESQVAEHSRSVHGRLKAAGEPNAPGCTDCHGRHDMLEHLIPEDASDPLEDLVRQGPTYSRNVPALCGGCHRDGATAARRYLGAQTHIIEHYSMSIHGKGLLESGLTVTATCSDCHSSHKQLPADDPESTVSDVNIAQTCGKCHDGISEQYRQSIHAPEGNPDYQQLRGMPALPRCKDCHSSHTVSRTDRPDFQLGAIQQCGTCHTKLTESYFETYHGKASSLGETTRAKCHDCHGAHDILAPADARSHLHRDNIVATCGKCHPGSHRRFAGYLTHATHHDPEKYPILFYTFWSMVALLVGTFGFFGLHTLVWLPHSWKLRREVLANAASARPDDRQFVRFRPIDRGLHLTLILSFFGLAITGMMLKFAYTDWAGLLSTILGGTETAGWIHRACAVVMFSVMGVHLVNVWRRFRRSGQSLGHFFFGPDTILPKWSDVGELFATLRWFVGRGPRPRYGTWTYWEKFDYFAVFWGVAIIGTTGLCLWLPELFTRVLPGWAINVATIIHSDEALLATGFIFTIHFFNTHFRPEKFPMDPVIFTGRMSVDELRHDKPKRYEQLVESGELEERLADPAPPAFRRLVKVFGFSALVIGFTLVALILYAMLLAYR